MSEFTKEQLEGALRLANSQRFEVLKNAFNTIHKFAEASFSPDQYEKLLETEKDLLEVYKPK